MSQYEPEISQSLKDHIWTQLSLRQIAKQTYDKHKIIWWEHVKIEEAITKDDFIQQQDIAYLYQKHKRRSW
jgi:hypothetical protein